MTHIKLRFVHRFRDRHGRLRFYFRRRGYERRPLPGLPGSDEFMAAYKAALAGALPVVIGAKRFEPGTVADTVARYLGSIAFGELAPTTQQSRRALLERFRAEHGHRSVRLLRPENVRTLVSKLRPYAQRNMLKALRGMLEFAVIARIIEKNPAAEVKLARMRVTGGFRTWSLEEIEQYRAHHALGTEARLALELLYGTMQRRGDVVRLGRQHIRDGVLSFRQSKTGTQVDIPVLPELQAAIDAMPKSEHLLFFPLAPHTFGNRFREWCNLASILKNLSAHGLRKAGATRLAEHGASDSEIMAWGGWLTSSEVRRYTKAASRKIMAKQAADKLRARTEVANLADGFAKNSEKS